MKNYLFIISILFFKLGNAQFNYVYNSNLTIYNNSNCDNFHFLGFGDSIVANWASPNLATIDYYNSCEPSNLLSIPYNFSDTVNDPSNLDGYIGMVNYFSGMGWNEYVQTKLKMRLVKDSTYRLTFKIYGTDWGTIKSNFGVCFEKDSIFRNIDTFISAQYEDYTYMSEQIIEKDKWETITFKIKPQIDSLQYIIFGYFPHEKTIRIDTSEMNYSLPKLTYYYIDDVYLIIDTIDRELYNCNIAIPTAFTPNNDGLNDAWKPLIYNDCKAKIQNYLLRIFDRWGNIVFTTNNIDEAWAATNNTIGTYVYYLQYDDDLQNIQIKQGSLELLR